MNNFSLLPVNISSMFTGDIAAKPHLGAALSVVMMLLMCAAILIDNYVIKATTRWNVRVSGMNKMNKVSANIVMTCVIIWLLIPLVATIIYSVFDNWTASFRTDFRSEIMRRSSATPPSSKRSTRQF